MATPHRALIRSTEPLAGGSGVLRLLLATVFSVVLHIVLVALLVFVLQAPSDARPQLESRDRDSRSLASDPDPARVKELMPVPLPDLSATEIGPAMNHKSEVQAKVTVPGVADPLQQPGIKSGQKEMDLVNIPKSKGFNTTTPGSLEGLLPGPPTDGNKTGLPPGIDPDAIAKYTGGHFGRSSAQRAGLVKEYGGTTESELAVNKGLEFLARFQQSGAWKFTDPRLENRFQVNVPEDEVAATSLALLCFLARGCTQEPVVDNGKGGTEPNVYAKVVESAVEFLKKRQDAKGLIGNKDAANREIYDVHCLATLALCELYGMTRNEATKASLKPAVKKAVQLLIDKQLEDGGWNSKLDKRANQSGDIIVTGWAVQALKSASFTDLDVPAEALSRAADFVERLADPKSDGYHYSTYRQSAPLKATNSVVGLLCRMHLNGWNINNAKLLRGVDAWILSPPKGEEETRERNTVVYKFYATQILFHLGGEFWQKWNEEFREKLLAEQVKSDDKADRKLSLVGSWGQPSATEDVDGHVGGRLLCTCVALLNLEVYYRQLPLHLANQ